MMDIPQFVDRAINSKYDMFADEQSSIFHWDRTFGYFEKSSSSNWLVGGYDNETVTTLLATGRNMTDLIQAKGVYTAILQKIQDDAGAIFVLALPDVQAWRSWLKEFEPNPMNKLLVYPGGGLNYATIEK
jgi:ABC-type transport system substrate-binding protein